MGYHGYNQSIGSLINTRWFVQKRIPCDPNILHIIHIIFIWISIMDTVIMYIKYYYISSTVIALYSQNDVII
jgi:hypothetical protein